MQPTFIPWLGYFDMIDNVDEFVFYDDVQLVKRSWVVRNRIKSSNGEMYLTIPVKKTSHRNDTLILDAMIQDEEKWRLKHLKSIELAYRKAPHFEEIYSFIEPFFNNQTGSLADFNINIIESIAREIGITTPFIRSSSLNIEESKKDQRLVNICNELKCKKYLSPQGSAVYIEEISPGGQFPKNGIELFYTNYQPPHYKQLFGDFIPYMSIVDLFFNVGKKDALNKIKEGRNVNYNYKEFRKNLRRLNSLL